MVPHFTYITSAFLTFKGEKFSINCAVLLIKNRNDIFCQYLCTFSRRVLHPKCLRHSSYGHYGLVLQENAFPEFSPCGSCILYQLPFPQSISHFDKKKKNLSQLLVKRKHRKSKGKKKSFLILCIQNGTLCVVRRPYVYNEAEKHIKICEMASFPGFVTSRAFLLHRKDIVYGPETEIRCHLQCVNDISRKMKGRICYYRPAGRFKILGGQRKNICILVNFYPIFKNFFSSESCCRGKLFRGQASPPLPPQFRRP